MTMTSSQFFEYLGAPMANIRWSWGAVRPADGAVFLKVWNHQVDDWDGRRLIRLWDLRRRRPDSRDPGARERWRHLEMIRGGAPCYLVMCWAKDLKAERKVVDYFNDQQVFPAVDLHEFDQYICMRVLPPIAVEVLRAQVESGLRAF